MRTRISTVGKALNQQTGFTYIVVLIALMIVGIMAGAATIPASQTIKRDKEEALLFAGIAYQKAIKSYYQSNTSRKQYPKRLEDLLLDNRVAYRRHIRQLYPDPVSGEDWHLIRNNSGGITGVVSSSKGKPLKSSGFPNGFELFEEVEHYSDWVFEYRPSPKIKKQNVL